MLYQLSYSRSGPPPCMTGAGWEWKESNLLSLRHQIYSLARLSNSGALPSAIQARERGGRAGEGTRTPNLLITNQLLYQLSYTSTASSTPPNLGERD